MSRRNREPSPDEYDRAWASYSADFRKYTLPKMLSSAIFCSIQADEQNFDVKMATELGAALLLGKPLLLVCPVGRTIPEPLRRAAAEVIDDWDPASADSQARMTAAMHRLLPDKL